MQVDTFQTSARLGERERESCNNDRSSVCVHFQYKNICRAMGVYYIADASEVHSTDVPDGYTSIRRIGNDAARVYNHTTGWTGGTNVKHTVRI